MIEPTVDLTNCDKEPIHIPGLIQPHGVLLVLKEPTLEIIQVSNNTSQLLGHQPQDLLGRSLSDLLDAKQIAAIWQCLSEYFENVNPLNISINFDSSGVASDWTGFRRSHALTADRLESAI